MELILATRKSKLAQTQTETVMAMLKEKHKIDAKKLLVVTEGDKRLDVTLDKIGGKGLFVKEIELALLEGKAQGAVHSMKDVPYELAEDFELVAMPEREDVRMIDEIVKRLNSKGKHSIAIITKTYNEGKILEKELKKHTDLEFTLIKGNEKKSAKEISWRSYRCYYAS